MPAEGDRPGFALRAATASFIRNLDARERALEPSEQRVLESLFTQLIDIAAHRDVVRQDDQPTVSNLLVEGWACRYNTLADGRRQILALHVAGDFVDLHSFPMERMDHSVGTLTPCRFALAPHESLHKVTETHPRLTRHLWFSTLNDAAILRQWLLGAGKRSALENAAHLICELYTRLEVVGRVDGAGFRFPLTQTEFGDCLGISPVHTNRVLQQLRRMGLVQVQGSSLEILDFKALQDLADFDPGYLGLEKRAIP